MIEHHQQLGDARDEPRQRGQLMVAHAGIEGELAPGHQSQPLDEVGGIEGLEGIVLQIPPDPDDARYRRDLVELRGDRLPA